MTVYSEYRKKPVVIDAAQWNGSAQSATPIIDWVLSNGGNARYDNKRPGAVLYINTLEGTMTAEPGDWVLRGVAGEFYPCKPEIFEATYEPA